MIGDDLVNSYHLLLCCLDLVFGNTLLCANRKDLINPTFRGQTVISAHTEHKAQYLHYFIPCRSLFVYWHLRLFLCVCLGLPALYRADGHVSADEPPPCVLERLCELHDGLVVEAKGIKQHYFKPYIQKLYEKQVLTGSFLPSSLYSTLQSSSHTIIHSLLTCSFSC